MDMMIGEFLPQELVEGVTFYECEYGISLEMKVTEDCYFDGTSSWRWKAENVDTGTEVNYLFNQNYKAYAPKIYKEPIFSKERTT